MTKPSFDWINRGYEPPCIRRARRQSLQPSQAEPPYASPHSRDLSAKAYAEAVLANVREEIRAEVAYALELAETPELKDFSGAPSRAQPGEGQTMAVSPLRYERARGATFDEMRQNVWKTELPKYGDAICVWVNEGDLCFHAHMGDLTLSLPTVAAPQAEPQDGSND